MIKISVVSYNNEVLKSAASAIFGKEGKTLGRSKDSYFVLDDPKNHVSRTQALVKSDGALHKIINLSQANPILLNGHEIDANRECDLRVGDEIQIGLYLLRAEAQPDLNAGSTNDAALPDNSFINPLLVKSGSRPLTSNFSSEQHSLMQRKEELAASALALTGSRSADATMFGTAITTAANEMNVLPLAAESQAALQVSSADLLPDMKTAAAERLDHQVLIQAFLNGAGIPSVTLAPELTPEFMELIGKLLATSVQGTMDLNSLRALVKREVNADVTMVVVRNNNPLKFLPDGQTVLTQMFRKKMPGFMSPVEAMADTYEDLSSHQRGIVAGTRAAMADMLKRLSPEELEEKTEDRSWIASFFPTHRKAKLWTAYTEIFRKVAAETKDDFRALFGPAFVKAYEREVERFKNSSQNA